MNYEDYLNYIEEAVVVVDNSLDVISFNSAFKRLFPSVEKAGYALPFLSSCEELSSIVRECGEGRYDAERRNIRIGPGLFSVHVSEICDERRGMPIAHSFTLSDMTEYELMLDSLKANNLMLQKSNEAIEQKKAELETQTRMKEKIAARVETNKTLGDLHDTLGHTLTVLNALSRLALIEKRKDESAGHDELAETLRLAKISLTELNTIGILTMGVGEETLSITAFLYRLKQTMLSVSLEVRLTISGTEQKRHSEIFYPFVRVVQEAATNCLRHANATMLRVDVSFEAESVRLTMEDNGCSLSKNTELKKGNGILGMEQRVEDYGGQIAIGITDRGGVFLRMTLPA